jgi:hypothetical protein
MLRIASDLCIGQNTGRRPAKRIEKEALRVCAHRLNTDIKTIGAE